MARHNPEGTGPGRARETRKKSAVSLLARLLCAALLPWWSSRVFGGLLSSLPIPGKLVGAEQMTFVMIAARVRAGADPTHMFGRRRGRTCWTVCVADECACLSWPSHGGCA